MPRKLHLAVAVYGVGGPGQHGLWKDPRVPKNASVDINYYIRQAQIAEQSLFDALFIVDSQLIATEVAPALGWKPSTEAGTATAPLPARRTASDHLLTQGQDVPGSQHVGYELGSPRAGHRTSCRSCGKTFDTLLSR